MCARAGLTCLRACADSSAMEVGVEALAVEGLVWYPDPSVQAHARTRITACACGKEGSGEMMAFARAKAGM